MLPRQTELALIEAAIANGKRTIITLEMKQAHDQEREQQAFATQSTRAKRTVPHFGKSAPKRNQQIKDLNKPITNN
jgi:hypothetical protein